MLSTCLKLYGRRLPAQFASEIHQYPHRDETTNAGAAARDFAEGSMATGNLSKKLRDAFSWVPTEDAVTEIKRLIGAGADIHLPNRNGKCAVHFAAQLRCDTEVLALLLDSKANINQATHRGHTPLIYAAGRRRVNVVEFLYDAFISLTPGP